MDIINKLYKKPTKLQWQFIKCPANEILYGGALGGGKSMSAVFKAIMLGYAVKGIKTGIFRRSIHELEETILRLMLETVPSNMFRYKYSKRKIILPQGSEISLNFIDNDKDLLQYQGQDFDVIIMDEAVNFTEYQITYLKSRLRSTLKNFKPRMYFLTNPLGISQEYLYNRFIKDKNPMEIYTSPEGSTVCYIPAKLQDNPHLLKRDPTYIKRLEELPEKERNALLHGIWDLKSGRFFELWDNEIHIIDSYTPKAFDELYISIDWGTAEPFAVSWYAVNLDETVINYREYYGMKAGQPNKGLNLNADVVARNILKQTPDTESIRYVVLDSACWIKNGTGVSIYELMYEVFQERKWIIVKSNKNRIHNNQLFNKYLLGKDNKPYFYITKACPHFARTIVRLQHSKTIDGDYEAKHAESHCLENCTYFLASRPLPKSLKETVNINSYSYQFQLAKKNKIKVFRR